MKEWCEKVKKYALKENTIFQFANTTGDFEWWLSVATSFFTR